MRKKWNLAAVIAAAALLTCACATQSNDGEERVTTVNKTDENANEHQMNLDVLMPSAYSNVEGLNLEPGTYLSVIGKSADGDFWEAVKQGAERAVKDINDMLDYEGEDKIKVVYSGPSTSENVDEQVNILDEELARYPAAVAISIIDEQSCDVQFDLAAENNIPIVAFDSFNNYQNIMSKISTDNADGARTAAVKLASYMDREGEIILFANDSKSATAKGRTEAFRQEIEANHPDVKIAAVYHMDNLDDVKKEMAEAVKAGTYNRETGKLTVQNTAGAVTASADVAQDDAAGAGKADETQGEVVDPSGITEDEIMTYIFAKHPNAKGIFATNGSTTMKVAAAVDKLKREDLIIIGFDAEKEEVKALKDGKIKGLIVQNPYGMGYASIVACARSVLEMGNEAEVNSGYTWVTKDNVGKSNIKKMLY